MYSAPLGTVAYVRGGCIASSIFGSKSTPPPCDISIHTDDNVHGLPASDIWYAQVRLKLLLLQ